MTNLERAIETLESVGAKSCTLGMMRQAIEDALIDLYEHKNQLRAKELEERRPS
jgi:hypothetical protein